MIGHSQRTWRNTEPKTFLVLPNIKADPIPKIAVRKRYTIPCGKL